MYELDLHCDTGGHIHDVCQINHFRSYYHEFMMNMKHSYKLVQVISNFLWTFCLGVEMFKKPVELAQIAKL